ncbi:AbrB/MazE/SpoVT family DNA-binding domain-containing protein [Ignisphaera sp. 4213-co]|uniref:AbrB/MazE/SpoVT family DNA-binding domain-containing protein n=1 Tax=Ignisphaera cupida TaxID=3050454 RepID=A0ABD4Z5H7_9CREN|nr:AbrB/MazE/SpoVT family DNA-binding domain-containing protein [Ignisphaera sp. 4213-co]MDK6027888.1 AbrB/MazE/SpoVT family DNA-binding domain-containing protein [Ignisphaera sp. 4213-co]
MSDLLIFEAKVSRKRLLTIPKAAAERLGIREGSRVRIVVENNRIIIEPIKDAFWYALHGPKIGYIGFKELEEESLREQEKIENSS